MKKLILVWMTFIALLSGCSVKNNTDEVDYRSYNEFKEKVILNNGVLSYEIPFNYQLEILELEDGTYSYTVFIDEPLIMMNQIQAMALISEQVNDKKMEPTVGIFEEDSVSLIPNQVDVEKGYPKGIALNGISSEDSFTVFVLVSFYREDQSSAQYFFSFDVIDGFVSKRSI